MIDKFLESALFVLLTLAGTFFLYPILVVLPVMLYADSECLRQGYPKSEVTIDLQRYCLTTEGVVVPKVVKQ